MTHTSTRVCPNGPHEYDYKPRLNSRGTLITNNKFCSKDCQLAHKRAHRKERTQATGYIRRKEKSKARPIAEWSEAAKAKKRTEERNLEIVEIANTLLNEDTLITVRRLHYLLVSTPEAVAIGYVNTAEEYINLVRITARARKEKRMSPACFVDETRTTIEQVGWSSLSGFVSAYMDGFNLEMWQDQPRIVEVIVEKDGLLSVLGPVCAREGVYLRSSHGQTSITQAYQIAKRFAEHPDKQPTVLYGGDHDGSGYNIEDQIREKVEEYARDWFDTEIKIDWRRWAFLASDFADHGIISLDPKSGDNNLPMFYERFGEDAEFAEVDSLPTQLLIDRVSEAIEDCKDDGIWQDSLDQQEADQKKLRKALSKLL